MEIYEVTQKFPRHELYGLTSQLRRAAISVPASIAEGSGRRKFSIIFDSSEYQL